MVQVAIKHPHFHALTHKNYRIFISGQVISLIGTWMQNISLPWITYAMTKSPFLLGLVGVLQYGPTLFFTLFAGVYLDRYNKKVILFVAQLCLAIIAFLFFLLTYTKHLQYWHILTLAGLQGIINSVDMPCRQSIVVDFVGKDDLMNAIALNSMTFNLARVVGPAIAGIIMSKYSVEACFLINALSFIPLLLGLLYIKPISTLKTTVHKPVLPDLIEGIRYIYTEKSLFHVMISVLIISTLLFNYSILIPVFAKTALHVGETGFGTLMSSMGIGSLLGALFVTTYSSKFLNQTFSNYVAICAGISYIILSFFHSFVFSAFIIGLSGFMVVTFHVLANSFIQLNSLDNLRNRAISIYLLVTTGSSPIGNFITGSLCELVGVRNTFLILGLSVVVLISILAIYQGLHKKLP